VPVAPIVGDRGAGSLPPAAASTVTAGREETGSPAMTRPRPLAGVASLPPGVGAALPPATPVPAAPPAAVPAPPAVAGLVAPPACRSAARGRSTPARRSTAAGRGATAHRFLFAARRRLLAARGRVQRQGVLTLRHVLEVDAPVGVRGHLDLGAVGELHLARRP